MANLLLEFGSSTTDIMLRLVVLCAVFAFVAGLSTEVSKCTLNKGDLPLNAYVHGCTKPPCLLPQLQNAVTDVTFKAPRTLNKLTTLATATVKFVGIPINIPYDLGENAVTCNFLTNSTCPVQAGEVVQYQLLMFIESFFPVGTEATVEFRIVDNEQNEEVVWCIKLKIRIEPAASKLQLAGESSQPLGLS